MTTKVFIIAAGLPAPDGDFYVATACRVKKQPRDYLAAVKSAAAKSARPTAAAVKFIHDHPADVDGHSCPVETDWLGVLDVADRAEAEYISLITTAGEVRLFQHHTDDAVMPTELT